MALALFHLHGGKVDPVKLSTQWNYPSRPPRTPDARELLVRALDSGRIVETFIEVRPEHVWYRRGREQLREYRRIAANGGWPELPDGPTLKPGMTDPRVPVLRRRLEITGDLGVARITEPELFDPPLELAVKRFQTRHGMAPDGAVGAATRAAMNVPVGARIDQLRVNLERGRWVLHEIKGEFVLVDVAGFDVAYFRDNEPIWTSKVVVGRPYRETPVFKSEITYVVLNPTWTIPPGILAKDTLPAVKRDPGYLARHRIRVIDANGREVSPVVGRLEPLPHLDTLSVAAGPGPRTTRSGSSRSCFRTPISCTCTIRPRNRCTTATSAPSAPAASAWHDPSSSPSSCSTIPRNGTPLRSSR